ncbi:YcaO-like family protein [Streptomyces cinerochromogenes]|uniref:YcaO-like family protein n=1 Tax=Streptomyces cinerochromogenes TaxID=66422 RepID=UPI0033B857C6
MALEIALVDGPYGLPVCVAYLWSEDYPVVFAGGGCHTSPAIALTRALTEAAQSRLAAIAGTRDDLPSLLIRDRVPGQTTCTAEMGAPGTDRSRATGSYPVTCSIRCATSPTCSAKPPSVSMPR